MQSRNCSSAGFVNVQFPSLLRHCVDRFRTTRRIEQIKPVNRYSWQLLRSRGVHLQLSPADKGERIGRSDHVNNGHSFRVLIVDRDSMSGDLLASALRETHQATAVRPAELMRSLASTSADLVVIASEFNHCRKNGFELADFVARDYPNILIVILLSRSTRDGIINAFRFGARGVFSRERPIVEFLECVECVRKGLIWVKGPETKYLLDAFRNIPAPNITAANEDSALTTRELQVVQFAAKGMTNKTIAGELGLSEHTIKNYLSRSFEKLGVSSRVELLFYLTQSGHSLVTKDNASDHSTDEEWTHMS
jgi:two-component system, NarL family, nitrate/nitrite response regulator NarL